MAIPDGDTLRLMLRDEGIRDERVLEALARVPRHEFVDPRYGEAAYCNEALPIGEGQTISQPSVVALMSAALGLRGDEYVLDLGTGSGYQAAVLALLARRVVSVERHAALASAAAQRLRRLGYNNIEVHVAGNVLGWPEGAPYDGIICAAAAPSVPAALVNQLAPSADARLVLPVGTRAEQELVAVQRDGNGWVERRLGPVRFVPLIGPGAWDE